MDDLWNNVKVLYSLNNVMLSIIKQSAFAAGFYFH